MLSNTKSKLSFVESCTWARVVFRARESGIGVSGMSGAAEGLGDVIGAGVGAGGGPGVEEGGGGE